MTLDHDCWIARFIPEIHSLRVAERTFAVRFAPVMFFEEYDEEQLHALVGSRVWEISFAEESVASDGRPFADYRLNGRGDAFRVLGSVAHGILAWAKNKQPDYLCR